MRSAGYSYRSSPRRVPLRGMRSETKGSAPQRAEARRRTVGERQAPPAAGVPVEGAGVPVVGDVVGEGAAGTGVPAGVPVEGAAGTGVPAGVPVEGGAGTGVPGGVTAEPAAEVPLPATGVPVGVEGVVEGAAGTGVPAGVPVEGGAGTGVPGGVTAEPAAEEPVEGAGAPGVPPPVGEPPCCALAPCFFLSRCTKLTAWSFTERARRMRDEGWNTTCTRLICPTPASSGKPTPAEQRRVGTERAQVAESHAASLSETVDDLDLECVDHGLHVGRSQGALLLDALDDVHVVVGHGGDELGIVEEFAGFEVLTAYDVVG